MICLNCKTEFEGDRCPNCGLRVRSERKPNIPSLETGPERISWRTTLAVVWEALKAMYFVVGIIVLILLLIIGLMFLVSWCAGPR